MAQVDECPTLVSPALRLSIKANNVFAGDFNLNEIVEVYVGEEVVSHWAPGLDLDPSINEYFWEDPATSIAIGDYLGVPFHLSTSSQQWTIDKERLFRLNENQLIEFQRGQYCEPAYPEALNLITLSTFEQSVSTCTGSSHEGLAGAEAIANEWELRNDPTVTVGSLCYEVEDDGLPPEGQCYFDQDCELDMLCIADHCVPGNCRDSTNCLGAQTCENNWCEGNPGGFGGGND